MSDGTINIIAIVLELGFPLVLIAVCYFKAGVRNRLAPLLGILTPVLMAYLYQIVGYHFINAEAFSFGYYAVWVLTFPLYCVFVVVGFLLSITLRSKFKSLSKYWLSVVVGVLMGLGFGAFL